MKLYLWHFMWITGITWVYNPCFFVNGQKWQGWFFNPKLERGDHRSDRLQVTIRDGRLNADFTPAEPSKRKFRLSIALLAVGLEVEVERGENAGRTLSQVFTILQFIDLEESAGNWNTRLPNNPVSGAARPAIAVWVSEAGRLKPIQAVGADYSHTIAMARPSTHAAKIYPQQGRYWI